MSKIKKKTIETRPDGSKIVTIEYDPEYLPGWVEAQPASYEPCAFDNLPPGVYGLVCFCPRCSPGYTATFKV